MKHFNKLLFLLVFLLSGRVLWANPVIIGNSRFTFITDQLVRMEYDRMVIFWMILLCLPLIVRRSAKT